MTYGDAIEYLVNTGNAYKAIMDLSQYADALIEMMDNDVDHAQGTDGREVVQILTDIPAADVAQVCRCKDCIHNNDCDIQYSAQAGDNFFCGFGETEKDVREDVYE